MTDKVQKIRKGIERLKSQLIKGACASQIAMETRCKEEAYNEVLAILDSLQEEPVSEDLEEAITTKFNELVGGHGEFDKVYIEGVAKAVAIECGFAGANWQKDQMMAKAVDALVHTFDNGYIRVGTQLLANNEYGLKVGDKVKIIVIKED